MKLRESVRKVSGGQREMAAQQTFERVQPHLLCAGVTRVANITGLDRIGIPVYGAVAPRSNDLISVYNGKGITNIDAKTSAIMESIERFAGTLPLRPEVIGSYDELLREKRRVMNPSEHNLELSRHYRENLPVAWSRAWDLLNDESVLVPRDSVVYSPRFNETPCYNIASTNGLAAGNSLEEAICQGVAEVIERDAITLAELISSRLSNVVAASRPFEGQSNALAVRLREMHPHVDPTTVPPSVLALLEKFDDAGVEIHVTDITSEFGIPCFQALAVEDTGVLTTSRGHWGFGAHPNAEVALMRAITECAQSRAADIHAVREDLSLPTEVVSKHQYHTQRKSTLERATWASQATPKLAKFATIASYPSGDVMLDLRNMLDQLRLNGISRVLAVDISPPRIPVKVVRVLIPKMESWSVDYSKIGSRAAQVWNGALAMLSATGGDVVSAPPNSR